ncbi:3-isopropylmalate dehydratase small subunit [Auxenochlorella protothecoides]|uniref:3-isopropylmalate dehydratase small subunit n=1 Tax=Auxenochlorella protothecoides TaxID=3075 RepID=A0A087SFR5_AUXPR|nr:3-isopropylmalate dehydratase small subunit [Auxenochlorella protothecoides]KFM24569.1 3-isopropylmalate dehydratase small subunit [Auxenochlorella protothecoides]
MGSYAMIGLPEQEYPERYVPVDSMKTEYPIIIGGENFGCGSSREHAPVALGAAGAKVVLAQTFARIFFRNCVATGELYPVETDRRLCDELVTGQEVEVDMEANVLKVVETGKTYDLKDLGAAGPVIDAGGLFNFARQDMEVQTDDLSFADGTASPGPCWTLGLWLAYWDARLRVDLAPGDALLVPPGWLLASAAPEREGAISLRGSFLLAASLHVHLDARRLEEALAVSPARQYPLFKQTMWHAALYWSEVLRRTAGVSRRKRDALAAQLPSPGRGVRESGSTEAWTAGEQVGARERLPSRRKVDGAAGSPSDPPPGDALEAMYDELFGAASDEEAGEGGADGVRSTSEAVCIMKAERGDAGGVGGDVDRMDASDHATGEHRPPLALEATQGPAACDGAAGDMRLMKADGQDPTDAAPQQPEALLPVHIPPGIADPGDGVLSPAPPEDDLDPVWLDVPARPRMQPALAALLFSLRTWLRHPAALNDVPLSVADPKAIVAALEVGVIAMGWSLTPLKATEALEASSDDDDVLRAPGLAEAHQGDVPGRDDDPGSDYLPDAREEEEEEEVVVEESNGPPQQRPGATPGAAPRPRVLAMQGPSPSVRDTPVPKPAARKAGAMSIKARLSKKLRL